MGAKMTAHDKGLKRLMSSMQELSSAKVVVGLMGESTYKKGESSEVSVVDYGTFNEFGTRNIPSRSFLRSTFDENDGFRSVTNQIAQGLYSLEMTADQALNTLGMVAQAKVQRKITKGGTPYTPNAPATIRQKGSSKPLIDTGRMRQSITYEVRK